MRILKAKNSFKAEFRRQLRFAITAAIGFSIAFAWRNALFNTFQVFVARLLDIPPEHYLSEIYTAFALTIVGVLLILLTSKLLKQ